MAALTAARLRSRGVLHWQLSILPHDTFPAFSPQPPTTVRPSPINEGCGWSRSPLSQQASPLVRGLATVTGRIGFTFVWDHSSASGCSPPRLTTTQLPSAALPLLVPGGLRLSLVDFMYLYSHGPWASCPHRPKIARAVRHPTTPDDRAGHPHRSSRIKSSKIHHPSSKITRAARFPLS